MGWSGELGYGVRAPEKNQADAAEAKPAAAKRKRAG